MLPLIVVLVLVSAGGAALTLNARSLVANGNAMYDVNGWDVKSEAGPTTVDRLRIPDGPDGIKTVARIRRATDRSGTWARALIQLRDPEASLKVGRTYRLRAFVRDVLGGNQIVGLLVANENYDHRPTTSSTYTRVKGTSWHQLDLSFVATDRAYADTAIHLALPPSGPIDWQITGVLLTQTDLPDAPLLEDRPPDRVLSFEGPAGQAPDAAIWNAEVGGDGWGNRELQSYVDAPSAASLDGQGHLAVTARREETTGPDGITRQFSSARLTTQNKVLVPPGSYVEAPITAPVGDGVWPAFWLLGQDIESVGWPSSGELDVLEVLGSDPRTARSALHMADRFQAKRDRPVGGDSQVGATQFDHSLDSQEHRYGVYFDEDVVVFYIDQRKTFTYSARDAASSGRSWPFGQQMFLIVNVAVGGRESPKGTSFPRQMTVGPIAIWTGDLT